FNSGKQKINEYNDIEITDFLSGFYFSAGLYYYNKKSRRIAELMVEYKNLKGEGYGTIIEMNIFSMGLGIYLF
ncbi:MAG: hypothetical protein HQ541_20650, partial [Mariniphaga sp.]|nr:hypothetical protein [Mariniphaga sp.]